MKNVEIAEGGISRRLSGTKFVLTDKPNSDQMEVWVDEDDRKLARLYATSNGTYYPEDYDAYGFSSVTVSIHGGAANPDLPNIEMPDGTVAPVLIPEIEMPDGTTLPIDELFPDIPLDDVKVPDTVGEEGSAIVGVDPEDGYTYKAEVDENGNLDVEKVPTGIRVIEDSLKGDYEYGDEIDPTGLRAELIDKDGNVVKTKEYPDGTIEYGEGLEVPETDTTKGEATEVSGKKNDQICNANTITYAPVTFTHWTFGGWVTETNYVSGIVGTLDGQEVALGSGAGVGTFLVTTYNGVVHAMNLEGDQQFSLYAYAPYVEGSMGYGWHIAATLLGGIPRNSWAGVPWSTENVHAPSSTILLPYEDMKPSKTIMRSNWDDPYNGTRVETEFGVYYIDRPV